MKSLRALLVKGLDRSRTLWPDVRRGFRWVHAAARILKNSAGRAADEVETRYIRLLEAWRSRRDEAGTLADAVDRFLKVTDSYRPGLFHCLRVPGLPATNNDLEQFFGAQRYHERRTTGRKVAWPGRARCRPRRHANTPRPDYGSGTRGRQSRQMAGSPSPLETAPSRQDPALPLPPQSRRLPSRPRTARVSAASFATLEKKVPPISPGKSPEAEPPGSPEGFAASSS